MGGIENVLQVIMEGKPKVINIQRLETSVLVSCLQRSPKSENVEQLNTHVPFAQRELQSSSKASSLVTATIPIHQTYECDVLEICKLGLSTAAGRAFKTLKHVTAFLGLHTSSSFVLTTCDVLMLMLARLFLCSNIAEVKAR